MTLKAPPVPTWNFKVDNVERWAFNKGLFTPEECDKIIETCKTFEMYDGTIISSQTESTSKEYRNSKVVFITPVQEMDWVYRRLTDAVVDINDRYFNFDLFGFNEGLQFTEYNAPGGKYDYHVDKTYKNVIRKLSIVVQLSDPSDYDGGDFEYYDAATPEPLPRDRGTMLAFPSWAMHRVTPVTRGTRHSLVGWVSGNQFR